ncbi:MAG: AMP-binding protein [Deltaproteobacteria bacterium]|jgi:long-chain acyl-CoA synthetase|nr:AMP-binding protein [Deltaproteobacteria bacterium]
MEKRWYKVWPKGVPRTIHVDKPFTEYIRDWALKTPDAVAIDFYGREISYAELDRYADRFAQSLIDHGLGKGDRVGIYMQNCPQFVISFFGAIRAGGVLVSLNPMFRHLELKPIIEKTGTSIIIAQYDLYPELKKVKTSLSIGTVILTRLADFAPNKPALPFPSEPLKEGEKYTDTVDFLALLKGTAPKPVCRTDDMDQDLALLQLTGGTTGVPKAAMISVKSFSTAVIGARTWFGLSPSDVNLGLAPFFHIMGLQVTMSPALASGGRLVIISRFTPEVTARAIADQGCTVWVAAPTMLTALVNMPGIDAYDFSTLRVIVTGGAPISLKLQQEIKKLFPNVMLGEGYGLTEALAQGGVTTPLGRWKQGFAGIPHINDMKIVDLETGLKEIPPNQKGEIIIKGPTVMKGYWNQPEETQQAIRDGWLYTGDIGLMDEEGYLKIVDRMKELILCSGFNVYPSDVENIMSKHPAILEVAVVGVPDDYRGESPKAFVALKENFRGKATEEEIINWCRENMASYKRPREVAIRESLPKSGAGKILKRELT